jgi:hypothetical protein
MPDDRRVTAGEILVARDRGDRELERKFLATFRMPNGVYRTTHANRLDDTAQLLCRAMEPKRTRVRVLDVGCSSGVSTVELHLAFVRAGLQVETFGSDLQIHAHYVGSPGKVAFFFDDAWRLAQIELGRRAFASDLRRLEAVREPGWWVLSRIVASATPLVRALARRGSLRPRTLPLVVPEATETPGVTLVRENLREPVVAGKFDAIRAANVLNPGYFREPVLRSMIFALMGRLSDDAHFLVARTEDDGRNLASLFRFDRGTFSVVERLNGGSEIEPLVLDCSTRPA